MGALDLILYFVWLFLEVLSIIVSLFGNLIVIYVMLSEKKLRKKSSFYIISIAFADLVSSCFVSLLTASRSLIFWNPSKKFDSEVCLWLASFFLALTAASILQLVFVSVDRFWAICHPISYHTRPPSYAKIIICMCWIAGIIFGCIPLFNKWTADNCALHDSHYQLLSSLGIVSAVIIIILYILIYKAFLKHVRLKLLFVWTFFLIAIYFRAKSERNDLQLKLMIQHTTSIPMSLEQPKQCYLSSEVSWYVGFPWR